jgi:hypothetical protein
MSVSSVGSANPNSYLQWPPQPGSVDSADSSDAAAPSEALQSLFGAFTGASPNDQTASAAAPASGSAAPCSFPQLSPDAMSALLSAQGGQSASGASGLQSLIGKFDVNNDGQISQSEFENAIGPNADKANVDALFNKLDANGDGSVDQSEMQSALQKAHGGGHHHHHQHGVAGATQRGSDPLEQLLAGTTADGSTSQSSTNADGSTSTTLTYADGSKVEMTLPAAASASGSASAISGQSGPSPSNILEQLINLQASLFATNTNMSLSI